MYNHSTSCSPRTHKMRLLQRNARRSVIVFAQVQPQPLQRMAFALRITPPSHILQPLGPINANTASSLLSTITRRIPFRTTPIVRELNVLPCVPRRAESVHIDQPRNAHESMLAGRRPQSMRSERREHHRMLPHNGAHRFREHRLLQDVIVARLLPPELERAGQPIVRVIGASIVRRNVHFARLTSIVGPEVQRHVLPVADVAAEIAPRAQTLAEQLRNGQSSERSQIQRA